MITLVVCSINDSLFEKFEKNVSETIGSDFQLIRNDNHNNNKSICEVYNEGLLKAKGGVICYCHEDIHFETQNWGVELNSLLGMEDVGLVGIAGATYKSQYPTSWVAVPKKYYRSNIVQQKADGSSVCTKILDEGIYSQVAVLDGCFISGRKEIFEQYKWNQELLKGFHLYDLDISIRVGEAYKVVIANNIRIKHFSEGNFGLEWLIDSQKLHHLYKNLLPSSTFNLSNKEKKSLKYYALNTYILTLIHLKQPSYKILNYIIHGFILYPFKLRNMYLLSRVIKS